MKVNVRGAEDKAKLDILSYIAKLMNDKDLMEIEIKTSVRECGTDDNGCVMYEHTGEEFINLKFEEKVQDAEG